MSCFFNNGCTQDVRLALICIISLLLTIVFSLFASKDFSHYNALERAYPQTALTSYLER